MPPMTAQKGDILAQRRGQSRLLRPFIVGLLALFVPALTVVTAFGIAPGTVAPDAERRVVSDPITLPEIIPANEPAPRYVTQERVLRGDTVAALFDRLGVSDPRTLEWLKTDATGRLIFRQLVPGRMLQAETGADHE